MSSVDLLFFSRSLEFYIFKNNDGVIEGYEALRWKHGYEL